MPLYDFHTHTMLSDGRMLPIELVRRYMENGCTAVAITDHVGAGNAHNAVEAAVRDAEMAHRHWGITVVPGVEVSYVPAAAIGEVAREAKFAGARLVVVHGESLSEGVEPGTNRAAVESQHVDLLAHPGLLGEEEAGLAARTGVFLELSSRAGHALANGHIVAVARAAGARLLVNSDAHAAGDLLTEALARSVALGAGVREDELNAVLVENPQALLRKLGYV